MPAELYVKRAKQAFDIIFCDPPFPYKYKTELISSICESPLVKKDTLILLHHPRNEDQKDMPKNLIKEDHREYGRSVVEFYKFVEKK